MIRMRLCFLLFFITLAENIVSASEERVNTLKECFNGSLSTIKRLENIDSVNLLDLIYFESVEITSMLRLEINTDKHALACKNASKSIFWAFLTAYFDQNYSKCILYAYDLMIFVANTNTSNSISPTTEDFRLNNILLEMIDCTKDSCNRYSTN